MPEITYTGPILIEEAGDVRTLTADDLRPEADPMLSERVDFVSDTLLYRGWAQPGTSDSASAWRIQKIELAPDGDVVKKWAAGTAAFEHAWTGRLGLVYT